MVRLYLQNDKGQRLTRDFAEVPWIIWQWMRLVAWWHGPHRWKRKSARKED
jgi:hypothetical protein